jgi:hypothetical protein
MRRVIDPPGTAVTLRRRRVEQAAIAGLDALYLLPASDRGPWTPYKVTDGFREVLRRAGVKGASFHSPRRIRSFQFVSLGSVLTMANRGFTPAVQLEKSAGEATRLLSLRSLGACLFAVAIFFVWAFATPTTGRAASDPRIQVVIYPATGLPADGAAAVLTVKNVSAIALKRLNDSITKSFPLYSSCLYDPTIAASRGCDPARAAIVVTTDFALDPKSTDPTNPLFIVTMRSLDVTNGRVLATLPLSVKVDTLDKTAADPIKDALNPLALSNDKLATLLGTPVIASGRLALVAGYEPYLQLVPSLSKADDPSYLQLMENLLDRRGLPSVPSQFNAGAVSSGNTPLDAICGRGQRYFVYSVSSENFSLPVSLSTRVQTHASGQLYDCTNMTVISVGLDQHRTMLTTAAPLAALLTLLSKAFVSKSNSWTNTIQLGALTSKFIDATPDTITVRDHVSDRGLQGLVDNLCTTLANLPTSAPIPMPTLPASTATAKPLTSPKSVRRPRDVNQATYEANTALAQALASGKPAQFAHARVLVQKQKAVVAKSQQTTASTPITATAQPSNTASANLVSLDVAGFVARTPPQLRCHDPRLDHANEAPPPSPSPSSTPRWTIQLH